ncbi:hypothetical protein [Tardiphaga sp. 862_B3_N1_1]|uniref:hypothetical protein n=1 Tax=Tardiphaga sp. 862_B3_N1_1 TaxID=3240763 RepID=UPI003F8CB92F
MMKTPDFPVRDFKLEAIARLAQEDWNLPRLRTPALEQVAEGFRGSISTVRFMMSLPTTIVGAMAQTQRMHDVAELELTGQLSANSNTSISEQQQIASRAAVLLQEIVERDRNMQESGDPDWDTYVLNYHIRAAQSLNGLIVAPLGAYGFINMFSGYITGTWTAIETMLGDLWEAALNTHPKVLATLNGKPKRLTSGLEPSIRGGADQDRKFDLNLVAKHNFDLRSCMGTIFRAERRFEFTRLSSIREAYVRAFSEKASRIDTAIANKSIDSLSAVRNVLLHKGGEADDEYVRQQKFLTLPSATKGDKIRLDGQNTSELIKPAIASCKSLMIAVDDWIQDN